MGRDVEAQAASVISVFYIVFNFTISIIMIYAAAYNMDVIYLFSLSFSTLICLYLLFTWRMLPSAHVLFYDLLFTDYDTDKKKEYESKIYSFINALAEVKFSGFSYGLSVLVPLFFCFQMQRLTLILFTISAVSIVSISNIIMSYRHLKVNR